MQLGHLNVDHAARDVVAAAGLDDHVFRHGDAADRDAVAQVRIGHQVQGDDAGIAGRARGLVPERFDRLREQRGRQERVHVGAHLARARQHVVIVGHPLEALAKGHGRLRGGGGMDNRRTTSFRARFADFRANGCAETTEFAA